jgi:Holliday junction resolvase RusA-like endonuclease
MTYRLEIPGWTPVSLNQLVYRHWSIARKKKRETEDRVALELMVAGIPQVAVSGSERSVRRKLGLPDFLPAIDPKPMRRRVRLTVRCQDGQQLDGDNVPKALLDGMVKGGFLVDDSAEWLEMERVSIERGEKGTVIEITDLD